LVTVTAIVLSGIGTDSVVPMRDRPPAINASAIDRPAAPF
jgi:hypothetical protein